MAIEREEVLPQLPHALSALPRVDAGAKRLFDVVVGVVLVVLALPFLAVSAAAVWLGDGGPVIYRQERVGLGQRTFTIWKFRTMIEGADRMEAAYAGANAASGLLFKVADDPRVTPVGRVLRRLSLDELPQLFNVLRGDMSLVGPRPLPVDPQAFDPGAQRRHAALPGITGAWQVKRSVTTHYDYDRMIELDLAYLEHWSLRGDAWLLVLTIPAVLLRRAA